MVNGTTMLNNDQMVIAIINNIGMIVKKAFLPLLISHTEIASNIRLASSWLLVPKIGHAIK